jgi:sugar lactone lactonase YvrE
MKTKIILTFIGIGALACGHLSAQRMPQDSWYLFKEFRGDIEGGKLQNPRFVAADASNNIYVADQSNHQIQVFDSTGNFLRKWGSYGSNPGQMNEPFGICVQSNRVYVSEWAGDRVQVFDLQGNFVRAMGRNGSGDGQMTGAHDLAVDAGGNVYVADHELSRVMVFKADGSYLRQWGSSGASDGQFQGLISICATPDGKIAVLERDGNRRVQVFDTNGVLQFKFGSSGDSPGQLNSPHGIRTDSSGNFYVSQFANRITVFNSSGTYLRVFGSGGSGNGQMNGPYGGALAAGNIYVASHSNHRVEVFTTTGTWVRNFGSYGRREFQDTYGIAVDATGNIYISSHQDQEVRKFDKDYNFIKRFGSSGSGDGQFNGVLEMAVGPNNRLYVVDHSNHRVQIFDLEGNFIGKFGVNGSGDGQFKYPWGVAVSTNRVYVADRDNHRIQIFDLNGNFIKKVGGLGNFGGQFSSPYSIALQPNGNLVVADTGNGRLAFHSSDGTYLSKVGWRGWNGGGRATRVVSLSDGLLLAVGNYYPWDGDSRALSYTSSGEEIKEWGYAWLSAAEAKNGDLLTAGNNLVRVWRRTFRTETPTTNNSIPLPVVLASSQRSGQKLLDLDYRVKDDDNPTVTVEAVAFNAGQNSLDDLILVKNFAEGTGANVGTNIPTGTTRRLTWDIAKDWGSDFGQLQMEILAKDNRDLLNLDFIQMPAVGGDPLLKISRTPLNDSDFLSVWYWLLATEDPGIRLTYGKVFPTNAATTFTYSGANGVPGLVGSYYPYTNFTGTPTVVTNEYINIRNWSSATSPDTPIRWDKISARWTGRLVAETNGNHTIAFAVDDNGKIFLNNSTNASLNRTSGGESSFTTNLTAGVAVPITLEFADLGGSRRAQLYWTPPGGTKQLIPPKNLFTGVAASGGTYSYYNPDGTNHLASGTATTAAGRTYIFDKMGYREATSAEVTRAKNAGTPGTINQWDPKLRVGPDERPVKVNAYNFETGADGTWVVPK